MKILVAEDEKDLNNIIVKRLAKEGYQVDACFNGHEVLDYLDYSEYDLILLDVMMPELDGFSTVQKIREKGNNTKVIFLTARDSFEDRIQGLDYGADDYIVKPFDFGELLARIRVHLRRNHGSSHAILTYDTLSIDLHQKNVKVDRNPIELTSKEYQILTYLMQNGNRILSREQILSYVWGDDYDGLSNIIDVMIKNIRKKLSDYIEKPVIVTKRGLGYVIPMDEQ